MIKVNTELVSKYIALLELQINNEGKWLGMPALDFRAEHGATPIILNESGETVKTLTQVGIEIYKAICPSPWQPYNYKALKEKKEEWG